MTINRPQRPPLVMVDGLWMMAHPVRGDARFTYAENLRHIPRMLRICIEEGFAAIAPYYELCAALEDEDPTERSLGRTIQAEAHRRCDGLILTGHDISAGMHAEWLVTRHARCPIVVVAGLSDSAVRSELRRQARRLLVEPAIARCRP